MRRTRLWLSSTAIALILCSPGIAIADAVLDGSTGSTGTFAGAFEIPHTVGRLEGGNLFHSFERFGIRRGESATFTGPTGIDNVISRVTGGKRSRINGALRSTVPGADFFFLNPAGVLFGPNASLDVDGSFHVSTADEIRFSDGSRFSARDPSASTFAVAEPESFGFLGDHASRITVDRGRLEVPAGQSLSVVGVSLQPGCAASAAAMASSASSREERGSSPSTSSVLAGFTFGVYRRVAVSSHSPFT